MDNYSTGIFTKKRGWRILAFVLAFTLIFTMAPLGGLGGGSGNSGNVAYAGEVALAPQIITNPLQNQTYAEGATARIYVKASSRDGGYLTYQWYRSDKYATPLDAEANGQPTADSIALITANKTSKEIAAPAGTKATLETATPAEDGYYYYWVEVTNNNDISGNGIIEANESALSSSAFVIARIVDRTLEDELKNGDFEEGSFTLSTVNGVTSTFIPLQTGDPNKNWVPYWDTTHGEYNSNIPSANNNNNNWDRQGAGKSIQIINEATPTMHNAAELSARWQSSLYQDIATVPGKIYEWSFDHLGRNTADAGSPQIMALVIGSAINSAADYSNGVTNRYIPESSFLMNSQPTDVTKYNGTYNFTYPYGRNGQTGTSYFEDVVNSIGNNAYLQAHANQELTANYNGHKYYVYISSVNRNAKTYPKGQYTVPEGEGTTVFSFVNVYSGERAGGNIIDNIQFKTGTESHVNDEVSFTGETKISAKTNAGFAYTLAEVRGSSVIIPGSLSVSYDADSDGEGLVSISPKAGLGDEHWYTEYGTSTPFTGDGTITFTGLIPGKTYRIIGIPIGAISEGLGTNLDAAGVFDDGYYDDITIKAATLSDNPDELPAVSVSYYDSGLGVYKAKLGVQNSNTLVEYAILSEATADTPNTASPFVTWTEGNTGELIFEGLIPNLNYYLVARPLGYTEISYEAAARLKIAIPEYGNGAGVDLQAGNVSRASGSAGAISIDPTDGDYIYGIFDPTEGKILQTIDADLTAPAAVSFTGLDETKTYQVVQRLTSGGSYLKGVRVYPYPVDKDAANTLSVNYPAGTVGTTDGTGVVPAALEYSVNPSTAGGDVFALGTGSSAITLSSVPGLNGSAGTLKYRTAITDGYTGASIQPTNQVTFTAVPAAPAPGTDYTISYSAETVTMSDTDLPYEQYNSGGTSKIQDLNEDTVYTFANIGYIDSGYSFKLRIPASQGDERFASPMTDVPLAPRPAAPTGFTTDFSGGVTINGLDTGKLYQYSLDTGTTWYNVGSGASTTGLLTLNENVMLRFNATAVAPASYAATISAPLVASDIDFGDQPYGETVAARQILLSNTSGSDITIVSVELIGADANKFVITSQGFPPTIYGGTSDNITYEIGLAPGNLGVASYNNAKIKVTYDGTQSVTSNVSLNIIRGEWKFSPNGSAWPQPSTVTATSATVNYMGAPSGSKLSWSTNGGLTFTPDGDITPADGTKAFSSLSPATTYTITVKALSDGNHNESTVRTVGTIYTKQATPGLNGTIGIADILSINYADEKLAFKDGINPANYTVKVDGAEQILGNGALLTTLANSGNFNLVVSRNQVGNYGASDYSVTLPITGKAAAPGPITTSKASDGSSNDGAINLTGAFQYRAHSTADETSNWINASGSVTVTAGSYDVRIANTSGVFGSKLVNVTVLAKTPQTLAVTNPGTLTYGTDTSRELGYSGGTGTGTVTFARTSGDAAEVSADGTLTISKAGTINVRVSKAGDADNAAGQSPILPITILQRDINQAYVTVDITGSKTYTGSQLTPTHTVNDSGANATITPSDYSVSWDANVSAGTNAGSIILAGEGNYTGTKTVTFDIGKVTLTVSNPGIKDKPYDGTTAAEFSGGSPALSGVIVGDTGDVLLTPGTPTFASIGNPETDTNNVAINFATFSISGGKSGNYELTQPTGITAKITAGFTPVVSTHYTKTSLNGGWTNVPFSVTPVGGYEISTSSTYPGSFSNSAITSADAETVSGSTTFYLRDTSTYEISKLGTEVYNIDKTAPTAKISYKTNALRNFLNVITFGRFFSDTTSVTITPADTAGTAKSGIDTVEYFKTTADWTLVDAQNEVTSGGTGILSWTVGDTFTINPADRGKYHIFSRITDNAGNVTVYFDSAIIYQNAEADGGTDTYLKGTGSDATFTAVSNGNTPFELRNVTSGGALLTAGTDYTWTPDSGTDATSTTGEVKIKNSYLTGMTASDTPYEFTLTYKPLGETYVAKDSDNGDNDTPVVTTLKLTVSKSDQTALSLTGLAASYTYGDAPIATVGTSGGSGSGNVSYSVAPPTGGAGAITSNDATGTNATLSIVKPGSFDVTATKASDISYNATTVTTAAPITVAKAVPSLSIAGSGGATFGQAVTLKATLSKVGVGVLPTGSVDFYVDSVNVGSGTISSGVATFNAGALSGGPHDIEARYNGDSNYKANGGSNNDDTTITGAKDSTTFTVGAATDSITIANPGTVVWGDSLTMSTSNSGAGSGAITWESSNASVATIDSTGVVTITGTGSTTITAKKAADASYNAAQDSINLTIGKATPVFTTAPVGTSITYGQTLSDSALSGGLVNGVGTESANALTGNVSWTASATLPDVSGINTANDKYSVTWTPTGIDADHYTSTTTDVTTLVVDKATPLLYTALNATGITQTGYLSDSNITGGIVYYMREGIPTIILPNNAGGRSNGWAWNSPGYQYGWGTHFADANFVPLDANRFELIAAEPISVSVYSPLTNITTPPSASPITYGDYLVLSNLSGGVAEASNDVGNPLPGSWAWTNPSTRASAAGDVQYEVTFTPDNLTSTPNSPNSGFVKSTANVDITVAKAAASVSGASASSIKANEPLSNSTIGDSYTVLGVFGEAVTGTLAWKTGSIIPSDSLGGNGTGLYQATATFTPDGGFADNYRASDVTISVLVTENTVAVTYYKNYAPDGVHNTVNAVYGGKIAAAPADPVRAGYTFLGWAKTSTATAPNWTFGASGTLLDTTNGVVAAGESWTLALYAVWQLDDEIVNVQFDLNYAGAPAGPASIAATVGQTYGSAAGWPTINPARSGYTFDGWNTLANGTGALITAITTVTVSATTQILYAKWTPVDVGSDEIIKVDSVKIGGAEKQVYQYCVNKKINILAHTVIVLPVGASNKAVSWKSSNAKIATVDANGLVSFKGKEGTVKITVTSVDDVTKAHTKTIKVVKHVTNVRVAMKKVNVSSKKKITLAPVLYDGNIIVKGSKITYKSSKPKIAKVNSKGKVTGLKAGKAKITIKSANGKKVVVNVTVTKKATKLKSFILKNIKKNKVSLKKGKVKQLTIKLKQPKATNLKISFKSSKPKIVSVDKAGRITALKKGKAKVTVKVGGKKVVVKVTVK